MSNIFIDATFRDHGATAGLKNLGATATTAHANFGKLATKMGVIGGVAGAATNKALQLGGSILDAGKSAIEFGLNVAMANEQAKIGFTTMLGSAKKADAFLKQLQNFAAKTPFEFPELQKAASGLVAVGINARKIIPIMTTIGNVTSGMGTGSEGVQRAVVALQQMSAAGRITAEDLNQLRDAGLPLSTVFKAISEQTGTSTTKLAEMARTGKLGRKELDALMASLESGKGFEKFNGLMDKQSHSLAGMLSTLKDTFGQGFGKVLDSAMPFIKGAIGRVSTAMQAFFDNVQTHQAAFVSGMVDAGNAVLGIGIAFTQIGATSLRVISDLATQAGLLLANVPGQQALAVNLLKVGAAARSAGDDIGNLLLPKLTAAQEQWVKFGADQTAKAHLRDTIQLTTNAINGLGNAVDGSQIKLKSWSDRTKLSAVNQEQLKERLGNVKKAFNDQIGAMRANHASQGALSRAVEGARDALFKELRAMGLSKEEAGRLTRAILKIPKKHDTKIDADASGAKAGARNAQRYIDGVHGKTVQIKVHWTSSGVSTNAPGGGLRKFEHPAYGGLITRQGVVRRQEGGFVPGSSPNIRADNIPAMLTAGEFVTQVPATRFWGGGFMQAVNSGDLTQVRRQVGAMGGNTYIINAPNYVGDKRDLVKVLTDLNRQGRLEVIRR